MIGKHEARNAVSVGEIGGFLREGDLNGGGAPGDEGCQAAFADAEEGFVDLGIVNISLSHY